MRALNLIKNITILASIVTSVLTYTYINFINPNIELEFLLILPMFVLPVLFMTFLINIFLYKNRYIEKSGIYMPLWYIVFLVLVLIIPDFIIYKLEEPIKSTLLKAILIVGNISSMIVLGHFIFCLSKNKKTDKLLVE